MKEIEEHIVSYIKQLSQDNQYILLNQLPYKHFQTRLYDKEQQQAQEGQK